MIRAIYRWRVHPERQNDFVRGGMKAPSESARPDLEQEEARSSGRDQTREHCVAIARWESFEALTAFWEDSGGDEFEGAELVSVEVLREIGHLTVEE